jgi:hypothetical protein
MLLQWAPWAAQQAGWPTSGQVVMAQYDEQAVVVYQAYRPAIAAWAVENGRLGGPDFSFGRMSWVKPNFLWMMYRSGWATKVDQERVLALSTPRARFDAILAAAVPSSWDGEGTREDWESAVKTSDVRRQWDPDHGPSGEPFSRRAVQLGLRGETLRGFAEGLLGVEDVTPRVHAENARRLRGEAFETPVERVYPVG